MPLYFLNKYMWFFSVSFFKRLFYVLDETYDLHYKKNLLSFEVEIRAQGLRSFYFCFVLKNSPFLEKDNVREQIPDYLFFTNRCYSLFICFQFH